MENFNYLPGTRKATIADLELWLRSRRQLLDSFKELKAHPHIISEQEKLVHEAEERLEEKRKEQQN